MATKSIQFSIKSISIEEFATIKSYYKEQEEVGIEAGYGYGINPNEHIVRCFSLMYKCLENPFIISKYPADLKLNQDLLADEKEMFSFAKDFLTHLTVLTIELQGILHTKLENPVLNNLSYQP